MLNSLESTRTTPLNRSSEPQSVSHMSYSMSFAAHSSYSPIEPTSGTKISRSFGNLVENRGICPDGMNSKAFLVPKSDLTGSLAYSVSQNPSPICGSFTLRKPRGKITLVACESCRRRKSKCNGGRPVCNTCASKNASCVYNISEDRTPNQLRARVRILTKELEDIRSIAFPVATSPNRAMAEYWANELKRYGFTNHSLEDIGKSLQEAHVYEHYAVEPRSSGNQIESHSQLAQYLDSSFGVIPRHDSGWEQSWDAHFLAGRTIDGPTSLNCGKINEMPLSGPIQLE